MFNVLRSAVFFLIILPIVSCEAQQETYQVDVHYEMLPQTARTADPSKIEVNELFSYHCGHCYNFQSTIHDWSKNLDKDVDFQRTHVVWNPSLEIYAKAYNTAVVLDVLDKVHMAIFEAIHLKKEKLETESDMQAIFVSQGVDNDRFPQVFNSFGVASMVKKGDSRARGYLTKGTPELVINGKYRVTSRLSGGFENMLRVTDFLVDKERLAQK